MDQVGVQPVGSTWGRRHESPGSGRSCHDGKYFIFVQVDVPGVAFKGSGKGFAGGLSCPSDKVYVDVVESYGGVGVVDRGYGRTCRWVRAGDPLLEGVTTLHFGAASRQASIAGSGSSVCVEARALMIGMISSGRERLSGQWRPGALGIPGESGSPIRTTSGLSTKVELAVRVVAIGVLFRVVGAEDGEVPLRKK